MRAFLVLLHRYIGLATALFLLMAGLTGSILAFNHELDEWLNPGFYAASAEGQRLPPGALVDKLQTEHPRLQVWYMEYPSEQAHTALLAAVPRNDPATGNLFPSPIRCSIWTRSMASRKGSGSGENAAFSGRTSFRSFWSFTTTWSCRITGDCC